MSVVNNHSNTSTISFSSLSISSASQTSPSSSYSSSFSSSSLSSSSLSSSSSNSLDEQRVDRVSSNDGFIQDQQAIKSLKSLAKTRMVVTKVLSCVFLPISFPCTVCLLAPLYVDGYNTPNLCDCSTCQFDPGCCIDWQRANYPKNENHICFLACDPCVCCSDNSHEMFLTAPERQKMYDIEYKIQRNNHQLIQTIYPPSRPQGRVLNVQLLDKIDAVLMDLGEEKNESHKNITNVIASYCATDLFIYEPLRKQNQKEK